MTTTEIPAPPGWPTLHDDAYYGIVGDIVRTLEPETEADPAVMLFAFLTMYGNACGRGPHFRVGTDRHPARLFTTVVGRTARARKGTAFGPPRAIMAYADPGWADRIAGGFGSGEALVDAVRDPDDTDHAVIDRRLFLREGEFARISSVIRREGQTLSPILRSAWDGDVLAARTRKGQVVAHDVHMSVLCDVTIDELRSSTTTVDATNGLLNRFLFVAARRTRKLPSGGNIPDELIAELGSQVYGRLEDTRTIGAMGRDSDTSIAWAAIYDAIDDDAGGQYGALIARAEAHILRLSVTYALTDASPVITRDHLAAAVACWNYCCRTAYMAFGSWTGHETADRLYRALVQAGEDGLDGTAQYDLFGGRRSASDLKDARMRLEAAGLAHSVQQPTAGRPRIMTFITEKAEKAEKGPLLALPPLGFGVPHPNGNGSGVLAQKGDK